MSDKLGFALHKSRYIHYDSEHKIFFAWNGSATVNVYSSNGMCIDMWTESYDCTEEDIIDSIHNRFKIWLITGEFREE